VGPHLRRACRPDEGRLTDNVLSALPKSAHPGALAALKDIYNAEDIDKAQVAAKAFELDYGAKYPKAVAKITEDLDTLLEFYK
jgi:putative transposase